MPEWFLAGLWGWLAGSSLVIGALLGFYLKFSQKFTSSIMAFGSGVLVSALCFELVDEAYKVAGFGATGLGFLAGSIIYTLAVIKINRAGAVYRKRSGKLMSENKKAGGAIAIAFGAFIDGIPESIVIGLSLISGKGISIVTVAAIFISNIPESLSSTAGLKIAGLSKKYIFGLWFGIAFISGISSICGYAFFGHLSEGVIAFTTAIAAGAMLSMIVDTMIPEAYENEQELAGIITVIGFLVSFIISKMS